MAPATDTRLAAAYRADVLPLTRVRVMLGLFVTGLVLSGLTAFPLEAETRLLANLLHADWSSAPDRCSSPIAASGS